MLLLFMFIKILYGLLAFVVLFGLGAVAIGFAISAPRYEGPVSDHFDGKKFFNPGGVEAKGFREVIGWMMNRDQGPWPAYHDSPPGPPPPTRVPGRDLRVTFVNHSTVLLQFDSLNVLTDPVWAERVSPFSFAGPKRNNPPGIRFNDLPKIDVLLLSHNHWDHLDIDTFVRLCQRDQPRVYCTLGVKAFLERKGCRNVTEMDWGQSVVHNDRTVIHCVPAQHFSGRGMLDRDGTLWAGFVVESQIAGKVYFAGDSGYSPLFKAIGKRFGPLRLALIPIGAYIPEWFMAPVHCSPAQAVQIHQDVWSEQSVAIHFGTFPLADDGQQQPVGDLGRALTATGIDPAKFWTLREGEGRMVP